MNQWAVTNRVAGGGLVRGHRHCCVRERRWCAEAESACSVRNRHNACAKTEQGCVSVRLQVYMNELHSAFNTRFEALKQEDGGEELVAYEWTGALPALCCYVAMHVLRAVRQPRGGAVGDGGRVVARAARDAASGAPDRGESARPPQPRASGRSVYAQRGVRAGVWHAALGVRVVFSAAPDAYQT
eukprot:2159661-Rhodomonas_salina.1